MRIKGDPAAETESRVVEVPRIAFGTDQAAAIDDLYDGRAAIVAELALVLGDGAAASATPDHGIVRFRSFGREADPAAAIECAVRGQTGDVILGMTF